MSRSTSSSTVTALVSPRLWEHRTYIFIYLLYPAISSHPMGIFSSAKESTTEPDSGPRSLPITK
jgi:hypothetical protein